MQFNMRMTATASAVLAFAGILAGCNKAAPPAPSSSAPASAAASGDAQIVKLASVAPMSGSQAHYGKDNANGVQMAVDELNKQ